MRQCSQLLSHKSHMNFMAAVGAGTSAAGSSTSTSERHGRRRIVELEEGGGGVPAGL